jgi:uncharacterized membrane protein YdcZ (DUF606 family)
MSGWKEWQIAEVVEASDFQNYVQDQVVQTYAGTAARTASLGTFVAEGMVSYLADTNTLQFYNGTAWENVSSPGDITAVTAGTALSGGGSSGDVTLNVNLAAVGSSVLASPNITGTAVIAAGTVIGNLAIGGDIRDVGWTTLRALATDASGNAVTSSVTSTELGYVSGVTSAIQTQINGRVAATNGSVTTAAVGSTVVRNIILGTAVPGTAVGMDGDVFLVYTP